METPQHRQLAHQIKRMVSTGYLALFLLLVAVIGIGLVYLDYSNRKLGEVVGEQNVKSRLAAEMREALSQRRYSLHVMTISQDIFERDELWLRFNQAASDYLSLRGRFQKQSLTPKERDQLKQLDLLTLHSQSLQQKVLETLNRGDREQAIDFLFARARPAQDDVITAISDLNHTQYHAAEEALAGTTTANRNALLTMLTLAAVAVPLALFGGLFVTRRVNIQAKGLEEEQRRYQSLFEGNMDAALVWNDDQLTACNGTARRLFGISSEAHQAGITPEHLAPPLQPDGALSATFFRARCMEAKEGRQVQFQWQQRRLDDSQFPAEVLLSPIWVEGAPLLQMMVRDLTHRKQAEERIKYLACYDALTDLPNQGLFRDRVSTLIAAEDEGAKMAVGLLDLDHFKQINDSLGHREGDALLRQMAERIKAKLHKGDVLARMGGDEFLLLLNDASSLDALAEHCEALLREIALPITLGGQRLTVNASLGVSLYPHDAADAETLIKQADIAMYRAKDAGGNNCRLFTETMNAELHRHLLIKNSLQRSLEEGDFYLTYQPKMEVATGRIIGMEALVRWRHPTLGTLSPLEFIPIAEENGFISTLSSWIFLQAASQAKIWQDAGYPALRISVNLSALQLREPELIPGIAKILEQTSIPPGLLEFEITEGITLDGQSQSLEVLRDLKRLGVHISIDDFGTGYSALSYLKRYPVDTLKIDKSFMDEIPRDEERTAVAKAIIQLAHSLGYTVVAEGVETREQLAFLQENHCWAIQGHLLSPAMGVEAFGRFLADYPTTPRLSSENSAARVH